jgi:hypothetical protein
MQKIWIFRVVVVRYSAATYYQPWPIRSCPLFSVTFLQKPTQHQLMRRRLENDRDQWLKPPSLRLLPSQENLHLYPNPLPMRIVTLGCFAALSQGFE